MITAFEYSDRKYTEISIQSNSLSVAERKMAEEFVKANAYVHEGEVDCPICEKNAKQLFFLKWGVPYYRCAACGTIFTLCSQSLLEKYRNNREMTEFRKSPVYQADAAKLRGSIWTEFAEWLMFRAFRYLRLSKGAAIIDIGSRYEGFTDIITELELCGAYERRGSILPHKGDPVEQADILLYINQLQQEQCPAETLRALSPSIRKNGLLVIQTRAGSGFDILTLKGENRRIYPYEHVVLPSARALAALVGRCGYKVLEMTTPGVMDVNYVLSCKDMLDASELFVHSLVNNADESVLQEFQRFLQKSCLSSFVQIVAQKI